MLQVIDAQSSRLSESNGAKVAGDFQPMGMRVVDGRFQFFAREVVVSLE